MKIKRAFLFLAVLMFFLFFRAAPAFAQNRIVDNAGLLSAAQKESLQRRADSLAAAYNFDLVIVTEKNIGSQAPKNYAGDFFDSKGYGQGAGRDGCLFLHVTEARDYWFSTSGRGMKILNPAALSKLEGDTVKSLSANNPYEAYSAFLLNWETFLELDATGGRNYNFFYRWTALLIVIAWAIALAIGFVVVQVWKTGMDTALAQTQAAAYVVPNSLAFTEKKDTFLYSTVTKVKREGQSSSSSLSGSKGAYIGSSGRRHGGGGGKY